MATGIAARSTCNRPSTPTVAKPEPVLQTQSLPYQQNVLWLYHLCRIAVGLALLVLTAAEEEYAILSLPYPKSFHYLSWAYLPITLLLSIVVNHPGRRRVLALASFDVIYLLALFATSAGQRGIGNFLILTVAVANTLLPLSPGLLLALAATLGMLATSLYLSLSLLADHSTLDQVGVYGALTLLSALLMQLLSAKLRASERLARSRAEQLAGLQTLNAMIIERMEAGILVLDERLNVLLCNQNARTALGEEHPEGLPLGQLFPDLLQRIEDWRHNPILRQHSLPAPANRLTLTPTFITLGQRIHEQVLVFLEDTSRITRQAQDMKLVSLGRLTASIAHEIRNPLAAISHAAQLLDESDALDPADRRLGQIIQEQSRRMDHLINDVLNLSRRRPAQQQLLNLAAWLRNYVHDFAETASTYKKLHLQIDGEPLFTQMDSHHLTQILTNLINNGLRHSSQQHGTGQVWLHLYPDAGNQQPVLDVIDDGPGIAQAQLPYLFEPFHTTEIGGTGLGLYICRELCEANEANLEYLRLDNDSSSCFRIAFARPYQQPGSAQATLPTDRIHNGQ